MHILRSNESVTNPNSTHFCRWFSLPNLEMAHLWNLEKAFLDNLVVLVPRCVLAPFAPSHLEGWQRSSSPPQLSILDSRQRVHQHVCTLQVKVDHTVCSQQGQGSHHLPPKHMGSGFRPTNTGQQGLNPEIRSCGHNSLVLVSKHLLRCGRDRQRKCREGTQRPMYLRSSAPLVCLKLL